MTTSTRRGRSTRLSDIRSDFENRHLTPTQRRAAFEHRRRWLRERPDDAEAKGLWDCFEGEVGREDAGMPVERASTHGFEALAEAECRAERQ